MVVEHRKVLRGRMYKAGIIGFAQAALIDCRVRNLTADGASLEFKSVAGIPDDFVLVVGEDNIKRKCHVIWRRSGRIGVKFRG